MTANERIALIRVKIERAKQHIRELHVEITSFLAPSEPFTVRAKRDPQTREPVYYVARVNGTPPVKIAAIAGDAVQNLSSALDHLAYHLVLVGSPASIRRRHVYFPISEDATKYKAEVLGKVKGMRPEAIKAINALKPYKGGNDLLWSLHRLNRIDKHRMLITVGAAYVHRSMTPSERELFWKFRERIPDLDFITVDARQVRCALQEGDELFRDSPDAEVNEDMHFRFEVVFGELDVLHTMLVPTLQRMADSVDAIIERFRPFLA